MSPAPDPLEAPAWFTAAAGDLSPVRRKWVKKSAPILLRSGGSLPAKADTWIIGAFVHMESEAVRHELIDSLKRHADTASLDAWMASVLNAWIEAKCPPRDSWVLPAAGSVGHGATIAILQEAVRDWIKGKERALAVNALDALGRIGNKEALAQIVTLTTSSRDHVVADEAKRFMGRKAGAEGKSREELEDAHIDTCGLDAKGERILDYGPRQFRVVLGKELNLVLLDPEGRRLANPPKPSATDDPALAPAAHAAWKEMKTGCKRILSAQAKRFEQAMITGRVWPLPEFQRYILAHPILSRMAQLLIWQLMGSSPHNVRVTEDQTFAGISDEEIAVADPQQVRLAHPLRLASAERSRWSELFADYRLVQPFPQLARPVHHPNPSMTAHMHVSAPRHAPLKPGVLYGILDNDGWRLGRPENNLFLYSWKSFTSDEVTAAIHYSGLIAGAIGKSPEQTITHLSFHAGLMSDEQKDLTAKSISLGLVPVVAFSEATRRLHRMTAETP